MAGNLDILNKAVSLLVRSALLAARFRTVSHISGRFESLSSA
jgi:hypothetical protein